MLPNRIARVVSDVKLEDADHDVHDALSNDLGWASI